MRIVINTVCTATVNERWVVEVPDGTVVDTEEAALGLIQHVAADQLVSVTDEVSNEHDRDIVSYHEEEK